MIPDCYVLCTLALFKNIRNPLIFLKNGFLLIFLACQEFKNPLASKFASAF